MAHSQGDYDSSRAYHEQSLAIEREIGDRGGIAISLNNLGNVAKAQADYASARPYYEESLAINREIGDRSGTAHSLNNLGHRVYSQGDYASARAYLEESLAIAREIGDQMGVAWSLNGAGNVAYSLCDYTSARTYHEESLAIRREIGHQGGIAASLEPFALLFAKENNSEQAAALWGAAGALREEIGSPLPPRDRERYDREVADLREALGDEAFSAAWAKGRAMTIEQAILLALEGANEHPDTTDQ